MEGKRNQTKHLALLREALEPLTPLVWHRDVWHMRVTLHLELDACAYRGVLKKKSPVQENLQSQLSDYRLLCIGK